MATLELITEITIPASTTTRLPVAIRQRSCVAGNSSRTTWRIRSVRLPWLLRVSSTSLPIPPTSPSSRSIRRAGLPRSWHPTPDAGLGWNDQRGAAVDIRHAPDRSGARHRAEFHGGRAQPACRRHARKRPGTLGKRRHDTTRSKPSSAWKSATRRAPGPSAPYATSPSRSRRARCWGWSANRAAARPRVGEPSQ